MSINNYNGWHVLYVKSRREKKVLDSLVEISIDAFLPMVKTVRQWSDRKKTMLIPLFPSYVFVNINTSLEFYKALSIDGACAYIRFGNIYAKVSDEEMTKIKILTGSSDIENIQIDQPLVEIGDVKQILSGPLTGLQCEILKVNNINRIVVRIDSIQKNITAVIPAHYLKDSVKFA